MRRAGTLVVMVLLGVAVVGCGGDSHTWQGEFTERLEGATSAVEEASPELESEPTDADLVRVGDSVAKTLQSKSESIEGLNPPAGCEEVQEEGQRQVGGVAVFAYDLYKNATPYLIEHLPEDLQERLASLEKLEREAAHCASG